MANKPIIDIDINDQQFKDFYELFQRFQGQVGELPEDWKRVDEAASGTHEAIAGAAGVIMESMLQASEHAKVLTQHLKEATEAQKQFRVNTGQGESGLKKMNHEAKELANTIFGIGKFMLKLGTLGLGVAAGGLFGIDKLAEHAVRNQRSARGLGLTTGQLRAFQTDFGSRYVDENVLESVANARSDLTNRMWLQRALGTTADQMDKADTGDLAAQLAVKVHDWWASAPQNQRNSTFYQTTGFEQSGISFELARQLGNTDRGELVRAREQYGKDAASLTVSDRSTDSLYSFSRQLDLAGNKLSAFFTNRVSDLGPSLGKLMETLEKDAEVLVNQVFSKENVEALASGIDTLTRFLGSQEFKDDVKIFVDGMEKIGKAILAALRLIAPDANSGPANDNGTPIPKGTSYWDNPANSGGDTIVNKALHPGDYSAERQYLMGFIPYDKQIYRGAGFENINPATKKGQDNLAYFGGLEKNLGLPAGLIAADVEAESGGNPFAVSPKGYKGAMQIGDSVIQQYGVNNPFDFSENVLAGSRNLGRLYTYYKGDIRKALAASNWGEGNLNRDITTNGDAWESHAPDETKNHIARVLKIMAKNQNKPANVNLVVTNNAGANVAVSANAGSL